MSEFVELFANNSIGIACLIYFMFRDYKLMTDLRETMAVVKTYIDMQEKRLRKEEKEDD